MHPQHIEKAARDWLVYLYSEEANDSGRQKFKRWLTESEVHARCYAELEQIWRDLPLLDCIDETVSKQPQSSQPVLTRRYRPWAMAAMVAMFCVGLAFLFKFQTPQELIETNHYVSRVGEINRIPLADGSIITLDSDSSIAVTFAKQSRRVFLEKGRAYFDVAANKKRPFYVQAGPGYIRVVGTKFDVTRKGGDMEVSVTEGLVAVAASIGGQIDFDRLDSVLLRKGEKISATHNGQLLVRESFDIASSQSWRQGRFSYIDQPLWLVIDEVNGYRKKPLQLDDYELRDMRVTMSFGLNQLDQLASSLEQVLPIEVSEEDEATLLRKDLSASD